MTTGSRTRKKVARSAIELDQHAAAVHSVLCEILLAQRHPEAALSVAKDEADEESRLGCQADVLWALGRKQESDGVMREVKSRFSAVGAYGIAESYALRGDKDAVFEWLDRAFRNREAQMTIIRSDRYFRDLRDDPRYHALLRKMRLDDGSLLTSASR
jgi:hypothetical protein